MKTVHTLSLLIVLFIVGCAGTPQVSEEALNSKFAGQAPAEALQAVDEKLSAAKTAQLDYYAPQSFQYAHEALKKAKSIAQEKPESREILKYAFVVDKNLENAHQVAKAVKQELKDVFAQRQILESNDVTASHNSTFEDLLADAEDVIEDIEKQVLRQPTGKNDFTAISEDKKALLNRMMALNIRVVKHNALAESKKALQTVTKADAKNLAPQTFQAAHDALQAANQFIETNVSDKEGVARVAEVFRFSVQHLIHVTEAVVALSKTDKKNYEKLVLAEEQKLLSISKALNYKDLRDKPIEKQASLLVNQASQVTRLLAQKNEEYSELAQQSAALQDQIAQQQQSTEQSSQQLATDVNQLNTKIATLEQERAFLKTQINELQQKVVQLAIEKATIAANEADPKDASFKMHDLPSQPDIEQASATTGVDTQPASHASSERANKNAKKLDKKNVADVSQQEQTN